MILNFFLSFFTTSLLDDEENRLYAVDDEFERFADLFCRKLRCKEQDIVTESLKSVLRYD